MQLISLGTWKASFGYSRSRYSKHARFSEQRSRLRQMPSLWQSLPVETLEPRCKRSHEGIDNIFRFRGISGRSLMTSYLQVTIWKFIHRFWNQLIYPTNVPFVQQHLVNTNCLKIMYIPYIVERKEAIMHLAHLAVRHLGPVKQIQNNRSRYPTK